VCVCLSVCAHISANTSPVFTVLCAYDLQPWLGPPHAALQYVMHFQSTNDAMFARKHVDVIAANVVARPCCVVLRRVLDDGGSRDWTSPSCKGCRPGAESAIHRCFVPLVGKRVGGRAGKTRADTTQTGLFCRVLPGVAV